MPAAGSFSTNWFDYDAPVWVHYFEKEALRIADCLEIGSWEGRSLIFTAHLFPDARLTCIDTFGSEVVSELERRFRNNIEPIRHRVTVLRGTSFEHLASLQKHGEELFDFIFIDGTHFFRHVLTDTLLAWPMLRKDGILVWDDYLWARQAYGKFRSKAAIDLFLGMYEGDYEVIFAGSQVAIKKLTSESTYYQDEYGDPLAGLSEYPLGSS
jgi:predicted O-methyltransferase YrrM